MGESEGVGGWRTRGLRHTLAQCAASLMTYSAKERTLFGAPATSLKEYIPLHGVARIDALIGGEEAESGGEDSGIAEPTVPLYDKKNELRDLHRTFVGTVARKSGIDHRRLNAELIKRTDGRLDQATIAQLRF